MADRYRCRCCGVEKLGTEFRHTDNWLGHSEYCKTCESLSPEEFVAVREQARQARDNEPRTEPLNTAACKNPPAQSSQPEPSAPGINHYARAREKHQQRLDWLERKRRWVLYHSGYTDSIKQRELRNIAEDIKRTQALLSTPPGSKLRKFKKKRRKK